MLYAIIDAWSLNNPTILNDLKHIKVTVDFEPYSHVNKYHFNFFLRSKKNEVLNIIQKEMKEGWYSFFWNKRTLHIVFAKNNFKISLPNGWSSQTYMEAQIYGKSKGIQDKYLNFKQFFQKYLKKVGKLK